MRKIKKLLTILLLTTLLWPFFNEPVLAVGKLLNDPPSALSNEYVSLTVNDSGAFTMQS